MSLRPQKIEFDVVWGCLRQTVDKVLKLNRVERDDWNSSFT